MIDVVQLAKSYGARTLFEGVSLKLVAGSRYGLVGANGSGKTTLLEIIAGDESPTEGSVTIAKSARTGVLRQDRFLRDEDAILDITMAGDDIVWGSMAEQRRIVAEDQPDATRLAELEDRIAAHDGYTLEARASGISASGTRRIGRGGLVSRRRTEACGFDVAAFDVAAFDRANEGGGCGARHRCEIVGLERRRRQHG